MKLIASLKLLPLLGSLTLGLAAVPAISLADNDRRDENRSQRQNTEHRIHRDQASNHSYRHQDRRQNQHRGNGPKHIYQDHAYNQGPKYVFRQHRSGHYRPHPYAHHPHNKHKVWPHRTSHHVIHQHHHRPLLNLHNLGFVFGLHTNNFDIILRD